jgi:transcriptional regulator with XRE-family HTH domain
MAALADTDWTPPAALPSPFARRVRELRTARGWSLERLQERSGSNRQTIREIEAGRVPYQVTIGRLADAFGLEGQEREAFACLPGTRAVRPPVAPGAFGVLLRRHRERAGLSQSDLARRVACTASAIGRYEAGERTHPRRDMVLELAEALGLSDVERDRLLIVAGYATSWAADRTVRQVAMLLAGDAVLATALRAQVAALARMVDGAGRGAQ